MYITSNLVLEWNHRLQRAKAHPSCTVLKSTNQIDRAIEKEVVCMLRERNARHMTTPVQTSDFASVVKGLTAGAQ